MSLLCRAMQSLGKVPPVHLVAMSYSTVADVKERIGKMVKEDKIVVFMKGTPAAPRCGFSNAVVQIFKFHGVDKYNAHDVLEDDDLRGGVWTKRVCEPTFPGRQNLTQGSHRTWKTWKNRSRPGKPGKTGGLGAKTWKNIAKPGKKFWPCTEKAQEPQ